MADNADDSGKQGAAEPRAGQRLAKARRAHDISMRDVAKALHLDEVKVQALEDNRFDVLGAPVFAKGYLRKYAELVNVPIDDVLADYYKLNRATGAPPVVGPPRRKPPIEFSPGRWIAAVLLLLLAGAAAYWWLQGMPLPSVPVLSRTTPVPAVNQVAVNPPGQGPVTQTSENAQSVTEGEVSAADVPGPEPESQSTADSAVDELPTAGDPAAGERHVQLRFSGDCWTEVTDANGRRLFFGLGSDGRIVNVSGVPPLRVLLGNNDNVSLRVDGKDYPVSAAELRGNTARLTIGGP
jgi:cytoskeleton protein RodZ